MSTNAHADPFTVHMMMDLAPSQHSIHRSRIHSLSPLYTFCSLLSIFY